MATGEANFKIIVKEVNGFDADPFTIVFKTQAFKKPKIVIADAEFTNKDGEGKIQLGQMVNLKLIIQNQGQGDASNVKINFQNPENVLVVDTTEYTFSSLKPNENKLINYEFLPNKRYSEKDIPIQISVTESLGKYGLKETKIVSLENSLAKTQQIEIDAQYEKQTNITEVSLLSDVDKISIQTKNKNSNAFAIVIGNKDYQHTKEVSFAKNDARTIKKYLVGVLGYNEGNILYIENATKSNFETYFGTKENPQGKLYNTIKQGISDVFIYYAGHGAPGLKDNKGYFVPVDCDPQYVEQGGYSLNLFYLNISKLNAKSITVITDACFSGAEIFNNISPIIITVSNPIAVADNCVVLSSSTGSQVSSWYNDKQHGMFTYFFLKALQDKDKSDKNKDGRLTFKEIFDYVSDKTEGVPYYARSIHGVDQTPTIQGTGVENVFIEYK